MPAESETSKLKRRIRIQKAEITELKETMKAIQNGEVDALVVSGPSGQRVFTLQSAEKPYRELVEAMNEGAFTISPDGTILYCNARFESMTRVPYGKLVGSNIRDHLLPESHLAVQALFERSRLAPSTAEIGLRVGQQKSLAVQLSVSAIDLIGNDGFCIIATDLSAQKQNAILYQQQEWLGTLLGLLPVPLVLLDSDLKGFTFINAKAREVLEDSLGHGKSQSVVPMPLAFENSKGGVSEIRDLLTQIKNTQHAMGIETILTTRTRKIPVLLFSEILPAMHGREPARLLMFQDVSTIKQAQLDLSLALKGRDQFMAALSHELRTPINVILGWIKLLRENPSDEAMVKQAVDTLDRNAELQRDLIENLLDMSRIVTGSLGLQLESLDLKAAVRDSLMSLHPKAEEKYIDLQVDVEGENANVWADANRIQQLISNLVQNAIKFTPPHGKIVVSVRTDQITKMASISVHDNGNGIDPLFLPHVFEQFKQENMTTSRAYGGLGLGLTICKSIVDQHHGKIAAISGGAGQGATFTVLLPLSEQQQKSELHLSPLPLDSDLRGLRILLVDDSPDNLALFTIWLRECGANIKTLDSANGVIEALKSFKPHVLLSDISMPGEDGYALIAKVRALSNDKGGEVPAGALTANARNEDRDQTLAAGFHLHIPKPVTSSRLLEAVRSLAEIGRHQFHKDAYTN